MSDEEVWNLIHLAEGRVEERAALAAIEATDERSRIPMEPHVITSLCQALRERMD